MKNFCIITEYAGPGRLTANCAGGCPAGKPQRTSIPYPHDLARIHRHREAAYALLRKWGVSIPEDGSYPLMAVPSEDFCRVVWVGLGDELTNTLTLAANRIEILLNSDMADDYDRQAYAQLHHILKYGPLDE